MIIRRKMKFYIARIIDRLFDKACWATLACWAMEFESFRDVFKDGGWKNQVCNDKAGYYCGKCEELKKRKIRK